MLTHLKTNKKFLIGLTTTVVISIVLGSILLQQAYYTTSVGARRSSNPKSHHNLDSSHYHHRTNHGRVALHNHKPTNSRSEKSVEKKNKSPRHKKHRHDKKIVQKDPIEPETVLSVKMAATGDQQQSSNAGFDAVKVLKLFTSCRKDDDTLIIDCYVNAYEELCKLFRLFGKVFSFVTSDVEEKIGILRVYRKEENGDEYESIQKMLAYEVEKDITASKKRPSGSRTLLRLHRALEFIFALLVKIKDTDNSAKFASVATKAYDDTLAKHHPWLVKKAVHVAMYMLPSRPDLLAKMSVEDSEEGMGDLNLLINELRVIFNITEELYKKNNLHELP